MSTMWPTIPTQSPPPSQSTCERTYHFLPNLLLPSSYFSPQVAETEWSRLHSIPKFVQNMKSHGLAQSHNSLVKQVYLRHKQQQITESLAMCYYPLNFFYYFLFPYLQLVYRGWMWQWDHYILLLLGMIFNPQKIAILPRNFLIVASGWL